MKIAAWQIIPPSFRWRSILVAFTIFMRAALNFVGLAMLLPVLLLILDTDSIHTNPWLHKAWQWTGFESEGMFIVGVCMMVVTVIIVKCLINLWLYKSERNFIYGLYRHLSRELYIDYYNRGLQFIKNSNSAVLARNVNVVCLTFVVGVLMPVAAIVSETALFLMLFSALAIYDLTAALLVVAIFIPAVWIYTVIVKGRLNRYGEAENRAQRAKARNVTDTYRGFADIEINNAFPDMLRRFDTSMNEIVNMREKNATVGMLPQIFTETGVALGMAAMVIINLGMDGDRMRILFGIFAVTAIRVMPSVRGIMSAWSSIRFNKYSIGILNDARIHNSDTEVELSDERFNFNHEIAIENLSFTFEGSQTEVISDLSLTIAKGEHIGIQGRSGAGKTTLFNLLLGFYEPTHGSIRIDGELLSAENRRKWQNTIGYVSQNVFLTDGTFLDNIALGVMPEHIDRKRIEQAIDMADLREFIDSLPDGADTRVGECGSRLSGGQRQRIGIARALYKQADILFFDEATSSLDNDTELNINRAIDAVARKNKDLTIVIIAHRESSLEGCDRIINIEKL